MTPKSFITGLSGDTEVAGTPAIAAPRALYEVTFGSKPKKNPPELLPPSAADCACGIRLKKIEDGKTGSITNRSHGSTYLDEKSVLTSGATPLDGALRLDRRPRGLNRRFRGNVDCRRIGRGSAQKSGPEVLRWSQGIASSVGTVAASLGVI